MADPTPVVRIPPNTREQNQWVIKQALDTGVYGLILPHLDTVEGAMSAVQSARYPQVPGVADFEPHGERGWWQRIAPRYWGLSAAEYYDAADLWPLDPDGNMLLMGIVEEPTGVGNLPDILRQVKGIGAIWAGPGDMSVALGHRGNAGHPRGSGDAAADPGHLQGRRSALRRGLHRRGGSHEAGAGVQHPDHRADANGRRPGGGKAYRGALTPRY